MAVLTGWKFTIQLDEVTGKIKTVEDNQNIKQSIRMILDTQLQERKIVPNFGSEIRSYMFGVVNPIYIADIRRSVRSAIEMWQKNIRDLNVSVKATDGPIAKVEVNVDYITNIEPTQERFTKKLDEI